MITLKCDHALQDIQKELQNQQGSIDATRESLNTLCRKYPSEELASLGSALTDLIKTYESVNQLSARTLVSLQNGLQRQFNGKPNEPHTAMYLYFYQNYHCYECSILHRLGSRVSPLAFRTERDS